ncbi:acyloxyacyl hydrolase [Desulfosediminicola sp.]|uniref:acyloxyacyl hydrolase n=1 Tax=Desulfosediminicola sp. TaxID=2886825 RepID=UPI003AF25B6A
MMNRARCAILCALVFFISLQNVEAKSYGAEKPDFSFRAADYGARIAGSFREGKSGLTLYEVFAALPLPWVADFADDWQLSSALDLSLGLLDGKGERGGRIAAGVDAFLWSPGRKFSLTGGLGVGVMGQEVYGDIDFAGPIFFRGQVGLSYWFSSSISIGYRYYHESNGSIYDKNPSLNAHLGEVRLNF